MSRHVLALLVLTYVVAVGCCGEASAFFSYDEGRPAPSTAPAKESPPSVQSSELPPEKGAKAAAPSAPTSPPAAKPVRSVVMQRGQGAPSPVQSFGRGIPIANAVRMIVPQGWVVDIRTQSQTPVSWGEPRRGNWMDALDSVGRQSGTTFLVDWPQARVTASPAPQTALTSPAVKDSSSLEKELYETVALSDGEPAGEATRALRKINGSATTSPPHEEAPKTIAAKPMGAAPASNGVAVSPGSLESWALEPGSLKSQLDQWAKRAGYQLVWSAQNDYQIQVRAQFYGGVVEAVTGAVSGLRNGGINIQAEFFEKNHVLQVKGD